MIEGMQAALDFAHDPSRLRVVSFMTDGYIGNEDQMRLACKVEVKGDIEVQTCPEFNLFGANFFS